MLLKACRPKRHIAKLGLIYDETCLEPFVYIEDLSPSLPPSMLLLMSIAHYFPSSSFALTGKSILHTFSSPGSTLPASNLSLAST